jgi:hypothetical protein
VIDILRSAELKSIAEQDFAIETKSWGASCLFIGSVVLNYLLIWE